MRLRTDAGIRRGPTSYLYTAALVAAWEEFPQTTLLGAAVRLGYLSKQAAAKLVGDNMELVCAGLKDLEQRQAAVKKCGMWTHPDCDFSGSRPIGAAAPADPAPAPAARALRPGVAHGHSQPPRAVASLADRSGAPRSRALPYSFQ